MVLLVSGGGELDDTLVEAGVYYAGCKRVERVIGVMGSRFKGSVAAVVPLELADEKRLDAGLGEEGGSGGRRKGVLLGPSYLGGDEKLRASRQRGPCCLLQLFGPFPLPLTWCHGAAFFVTSTGMTSLAASRSDSVQLGVWPLAGECRVKRRRRHVKRR